MSVSVALVGAAPTFSTTPADDTVTSGDDLQLLYAVTSNANGLDNYNLRTASVVDGANNTGNLGAPGAKFLQDASGTTVITNLDLGAAITAGANDTSNQVFIPAGAEVNLAEGMYVELAGGVYKIEAGGITAGTVPDINNDEVFARIDLATTTDLPGDPRVTGADFNAGDIGAGVQLGEQRQFRAVVTGGTLTGDSTRGTHTIDFEATADTGGASATDQVVVTVEAATVFFTKSVAPVTGANPDGTGGAVGTYESSPTFDISPGDVLEYKILVGPTSGQPAISNAEITDQSPNFTAYVADSLKLNGVQVSTVNGSDGGTLPLETAFQVNSPNSGIDDGSGNDGTGELGVIDAGASAEVIFRVIVD